MSVGVTDGLLGNESFITNLTVPKDIIADTTYSPRYYSILNTDITYGMYVYFGYWSMRISYFFFSC